MIKKNIAIILLILNTVSLCAQDKIVSLGKDTIKCFIHEIGDTEIKYSMEGYRADLLFGIDKNKIKDVIFADGRTLHFKDSMHDPSYYENQRKNALKINFLSPLFGSTGFSFERSLGVARSIEGDLGIIGLGFNNIYNNPKGIYLKCGYKFIKGPDYYLKGMHYAHILKGAYIKPEIAFSSYF